MKSLSFQKLAHIHHNPVSKKWNLVDDLTDYERSSASFYKRGERRYKKVMHIGDALSDKVPGSLSTQSQAVKTPGEQ
jgi:hypothetical protein